MHISSRKVALLLQLQSWTRNTCFRFEFQIFAAHELAFQHTPVVVTAWQTYSTPKDGLCLVSPLFSIHLRRAAENAKQLLSRCCALGRVQLVDAPSGLIVPTGSQGKMVQVVCRGRPVTPADVSCARLVRPHLVLPCQTHFVPGVFST